MRACVCVSCVRFCCAGALFAFRVFFFFFAGDFFALYCCLSCFCRVVPVVRLMPPSAFFVSEGVFILPTTTNGKLCASMCWSSPPPSLTLVVLPPQICGVRPDEQRHPPHAGSRRKGASAARTSAGRRQRGRAPRRAGRVHHPHPQDEERDVPPHPLAPRSVAGPRPGLLGSVLCAWLSTSLFVGYLQVVFFLFSAGLHLSRHLIFTLPEC